MQQEHLSRNQRILAHLKDAWQLQKNLSPDVLERVTELIVNLPEEDEEIGLQVLADNIVSSMHLHLLGLVDTFKQKAEQEGILAKHCEETLNDVLPDIFNVIRKTKGQVLIHSLDNLATLTNITLSLQVASETDSAEVAQTWLYELPSLYYNRLLTTNLVIDKQKQFDEALQLLQQRDASLRNTTSIIPLKPMEMPEQSGFAFSQPPVQVNLYGSPLQLCA